VSEIAAVGRYDLMRPMHFYRPHSAIHSVWIYP